MSRPYMRGRKHGGGPSNKEHHEVRVTVDAVDRDSAVHAGLREIGSRVDDGYIQFYERIGLYNDPPKVSEMDAAGDGKIHYYRHSGGSMKQQEEW